MSEHLVIRLGENPNELTQWIAVDSTGARRSLPGAGALAEAANDIGDRNVIILVPGPEVLTTSVDIPLKGAKIAGRSALRARGIPRRRCGNPAFRGRQ